MEVADLQFFDLRDVQSLAGKWLVDCGRRVSERRKLLNVDTKKFAAMVGTTEATISRIESGKLNAKDYMRLAIAATLQVEVEDLWRYPRRTEVFSGAGMGSTS